MSGILDWLFGPSRSEHPTPRANDWEMRRSEAFSRRDRCSAWLDRDGKLRDKVCGLTLDESLCSEKKHLDAKRLGIADRHDVIDHEANVERRYLKGKGKHDSPKNYAARVRVRRELAMETGNPCRRAR